MAPVHTNPEEALQAHDDLESRMSIGIHYATFSGLTDEGIYEPEMNTITKKKRNFDIVALESRIYLHQNKTISQIYTFSSMNKLQSWFSKLYKFRPNLLLRFRCQPFCLYKPLSQILLCF